MSTVASPYGFKPINLIGGLPFSGSTRSIPIASAYGTNIFYGSLVYVQADGTLAIATYTGADATTNGFPVGTANTGCVGVFLGCSFTSPVTKQKLFSQYWPTGTVAADAVGIVCDDDRTVFQVQSVGTVATTALGANFFLGAAQSTSTGSTATGNSTTAVCTGANSVQTTAAFRCIGFVDMVGLSVAGDAYTDILVKFNPGYHSYTNAVGL
jgi:hypothetical protein